MENGIHGRAELLGQLREARSILEAERAARVFGLGGDCGIEVALLSHLSARHAGALAVVWLDAHPDLNTPESSPSGHFHGMPLRVLLGDGDPEFTALRRAPAPAVPDRARRNASTGSGPSSAFIEARRLTALSPGALTDGPDALLRWLRATRLDRAYVHLDLDVCEPREVPTVACPAPGGVAVDALLRTLEAISDEVEIVGAAITETLLDGGPVPPALEPILRWFRDA